MIKLTSDSSFEIKSHNWIVFTISNQGITVGDIEIGQKVIINEGECVVRGIDSFAIGEPRRSEQTTFGIAVDKK